MLPLRGREVLDVGCGRGQWLADFESWGAEQRGLRGIELDEGRASLAKRRLHDADIRVGDASRLPWSDASFDIVVQSMAFTSILLADMKRDIAREMVRVLKRDGMILWYDFFWNNPKNPNVKGIRAREIRELFPGCDVRLKRITLAPPIARRLVPFTWVGCLLLEKMRFLYTHYLGTITRRDPEDTETRSTG